MITLILRVSGLWFDHIQENCREFPPLTHTFMVMSVCAVYARAVCFWRVFFVSESTLFFLLPCVLCVLKFLYTVREYGSDMHIYIYIYIYGSDMHASPPKVCVQYMQVMLFCTYSFCCVRIASVSCMCAVWLGSFSVIGDSVNKFVTMSWTVTLNSYRYSYS